MLSILEIIILKFAIFLEHLANYLKSYITQIVNNKFTSLYSLSNISKTPAIFPYSKGFPHETTNIILIDTLLNTNILDKEKPLLDVGCGSGIFLIYLAHKGFHKLIGIDENINCINIAKKNIISFKEHHNNMNISIDLIHADVTKMDIDDNICYFYLFNPFGTESIYLIWFNKVRDSLLKNNRDITIILLCPMPHVIAALSKCSWLKITQVISEPKIKNYHTLKFLIIKNI